MRTKRRYARELYPHPGEWELRPLAARTAPNKAEPQRRSGRVLVCRRTRKPVPAEMRQVTA